MLEISAYGTLGIIVVNENIYGIFIKEGVDYTETWTKTKPQCDQDKIESDRSSFVII